MGMTSARLPRPCKYCGVAGTHLEFTCYKRPKKPINTRKPTKKAGKYTIKWIETKKKWLELNKAPYYFCYICGKMMTKSQLTLDHVKSRSRHPELRYVLSNLEPCCWDCNIKKGSKDVDNSSTTVDKP